MIRVAGKITDASGNPIPGAIIELRSLKSSAQVLFNSVLVKKCDRLGQYSFDLLDGAYDVYAQNDTCADLDYLGVGEVSATSKNGTLQSILVNGGIDLSPDSIGGTNRRGPITVSTSGPTGIPQQFEEWVVVGGVTGSQMLETNKMV